MSESSFPQARFLRLAAEIIETGEPIPTGDLEKMVRLDDAHVHHLFAGASLIRDHYFKNRVHLCVISNGKSGRCSEDCAFCAQSGHYPTQAEIYPLRSAPDLLKEAEPFFDTPVNRYAVVTSGRGLPDPEVDRVCEAFKAMGRHGLSLCASLGILNPSALKKLAGAGVTRYHHNLETARSCFDAICTTHSYDERVNTVKAAKKAGLSVCSGGIFGMGESDEQVTELALELKKLDVDAVPLNFLSPIPGTPLEHTKGPSPMRCLKIIALFRYILPDRQILVCGGRQANLGVLHPLIFYAGASGMMTGSYLTTEGELLENDLKMLRDMGLEPF